MTNLLLFINIEMNSLDEPDSFIYTVIPHFTNSRFTKPRNYKIDFLK